MSTATVKKATTKVVSKPKPKAPARRSKTVAPAKPVFVYDFWVHNVHNVLKDWLDKGFVEIIDGGYIEWTYDDTACYSWPRVGAYPDRLWGTPEERFAPVLGVGLIEVPWFWSLTRDKHAAAIAAL